MIIFVLNCKSKAYLAFEFIQASTFNPLGSLSSTDNKTNKNEKLQKVKVRNKKWYYQNHKLWSGVPNNSRKVQSVLPSTYDVKTKNMLSGFQIL